MKTQLYILDTTCQCYLEEGEINFIQLIYWGMFAFVLRPRFDRKKPVNAACHVSRPCIFVVILFRITKFALWIKCMQWMFGGVQGARKLYGEMHLCTKVVSTVEMLLGLYYKTKTLLLQGWFFSHFFHLSLNYKFYYWISQGSNKKKLFQKYI